MLPSNKRRISARFEINRRRGIYIRIKSIYIGAHEPPEGRQGASNYVQRHLILSGSDTFLILTYPQVGNLPLWSLRIRVKQAQRTACRRAGILLFRARAVNSHIVNITRRDAVQGSTMEPERGDSKSERLRKWKAATPHRPAKQPRLFQADQQETELRQLRTFRNLAVYYAANLHGSCVNRAKSA